MRQLSFFIALLLVSGLSSCYQPKEGCLDVYATNYQVEVDRPCSDCCEYPVLRLNFSHKVSEGDKLRNVVYNDSVYFDGGGNPFRIRKILYYLSELHLTRPNGEEVGVIDTLGLLVPQAGGDTSAQYVEDNFALVNPTSFSQKQIGTIIADGQFDRLRFLLGLQHPAETADPLPLASSHPLASQDMYRPEPGRRLFNRIELYRITPAADTLETILEIGLPENLRQVELPISFFLDPGFNPKALLGVDYGKWFGAINLAAETEEEMIQNIVNVLTKSFSIVEVVEEGN